MRRIPSLALVAVTAAIIGVGPAVAPEHVHQRDEHHGNVTLHRHVAAHGTQQSSDRARLDDDDDHIIWLAAAWLQTTSYHISELSTAATTISVSRPSDLGWTAVVLDDAAPPHGPPRTTRAPRAPPLPA